MIQNDVSIQRMRTVSTRYNFFLQSHAFKTVVMNGLKLYLTNKKNSVNANFYVVKDFELLLNKY